MPPTSDDPRPASAILSAAALTGDGLAPAAAGEATSVPQQSPGPSSNVTGFPDRDNPLAWKRKTREGKLGARDLLTALTDEEVDRYVSVANDQVRIEERLWVLKIGSAIAGLGLAMFAVWHAVRSGVGRTDIAGLGLGALMVYWPWRVFKCRALWMTHLHAAKVEQARRNV